jgi:hypothetical protein
MPWLAVFWAKAGMALKAMAAAARIDACFIVTSVGILKTQKG